MEALAELLILLLFLLGPTLLGYVLGNVYPIERLRALCGTAPPLPRDVERPAAAPPKDPAAPRPLDPEHARLRGFVSALQGKNHDPGISDEDAGPWQTGWSLGIGLQHHVPAEHVARLAALLGEGP